MYDIDVGCSLKGSTASMMGPRGTSLPIVKQAPRGALFRSGQIWRGVVSDVILIPTLFLQVRENGDVPPVHCDMVLHRNSIVIVLEA